LVTGRHKNCGHLQRKSAARFTRRPNEGDRGPRIWVAQCLQTAVSGHVMPGMQEEAAEKVDAGLRKALAGQPDGTDEPTALAAQPT